MSTKIRGGAIQDGSVNENALSKSVFEYSANMFKMTDKYTIGEYNAEYDAYLLVDDVDNTIKDRFKSYLQRGVTTGSFGVLWFKFSQNYNPVSIIPFTKLNLYETDIYHIVMGDFTSCTQYIKCIFGVALDDDNSLALNISFTYAPDEDKLYFHIFEI